VALRTERGERVSALLELGEVVATPGALEALAEARVEPHALLARHQSGDWGEISPEDASENARSFEHGWRVLSSYPLPTGQRVWVLTEADRSVTTLLRPEDY
jgi:hypothetical protein